MKKVVAMYDIRGIQKYIYRTQKVKDAMGASALVENIIEDALKEATKEYEAELKWHDKEEALPFVEKDIACQVLFIGGGNAYVLFRKEDICKEVNQVVSRYILEKTYSLQLASAHVSKSENYSEDYKRLHEEMNCVKANIKNAKPIGALPIMQTEIKTGYPLTVRDEQEGLVSTETKIKNDNKRKRISEDDEKIFDNLVYEKGIDSNLAVVHIDGNNMGLRIRNLIQDKASYEDAVNEMRKISFNIKNSYAATFSQMKDKFETRQDDKKKIRKIVVAGDDITYVCNARIALDTVEYFAKTIAGYTMNGEMTKEAHNQYGFSICAGVAYMQSHFPFAIAYDVAEACCDNAKDRAKSAENKDGERIGNYVDFQICRSIQCRNLNEMREKDYVTPTGEKLFIRPYYIPTDYDGGLKKERDVIYHYDNFKEYVKYFLDENIPRSYAKKIRNTYPFGSHQMKSLSEFLKSRGWKMPVEKNEMFGSADGKEDRDIAWWYDALEMMDYCVEWKGAEDKKEGEHV